MSFDINVILDNWHYFALGLGKTILICLISLPIGFALGALLALVRLRGGRLLNAVALGYIEIIRNIPFLVQVFLLFFALPFAGIRLSPMTAGIIALASYAAAYFSEIVRGGIVSIAKGQGEAARALGLTYAQTFWKVLFPQIVGYVMPASTNLTITLIKESAALSIITVGELTYMAQDVIGRTYAPAEVFALLALLYWGLTAFLAALATRLETYLQPYRGLPRSANPQPSRPQ
jgi:His/Glu/Gln/Arg/opine family amino acid ABC transporter permease subunit